MRKLLVIEVGSKKIVTKPPRLLTQETGGEGCGDEADPRNHFSMKRKKGHIMYTYCDTYISLLLPSIHFYTQRCLHFTAQFLSGFLPNDSRLSPGGLPSFFSQREICHQLSTTDLERSVSDVGSVDLLRIWF